MNKFFTKTLPALKAVVKMILQQKNSLILAFNLLTVLGFAILLISYWLFSPAVWRELGGKAGSLAAIMLCLSLLPGIIGRFQLIGPAKDWFIQVRIGLMSLRRQSGQAVYLAALAHWFLIKIYPSLNYQLDLTARNKLEQMGFLALVLATPLMLTSNELSLELLKKGWNKLHKLAYLVAVFVLLHLLLLAKIKSITLLVAGTILLEAISWLSYWRRERDSNP